MTKEELLTTARSLHAELGLNAADAARYNDMDKSQLVTEVVMLKAMEGRGQDQGQGQGQLSDGRAKAEGQVKRDEIARLYF